jgi:hypothetical protein
MHTGEQLMHTSNLLKPNIHDRITITIINAVTLYLRQPLGRYSLLTDSGHGVSYYGDVVCFLWGRSLILNITSRQGNNEEQAHMRNKGTNEHDWKETAIFLETSINT